MNGTNYLLDTNAIIGIVNDNEKLLALLNKADFVAISIISVIEFLSYPNLSQKDKNVFKKMTLEASVIDLNFENSTLINSISEIRVAYRIKLPDAVLAATAITYNLQFLTNDRGFNQIDSLTIINF